MPIQETAPFRTVYNNLHQEERSSLPLHRGERYKRSLLLSSIHQAPEVFQPRGGAFVSAMSEAHVEGLITSIFAASGHNLDPVVVWWSGQNWYLIDGHHRVEAYKRAAKKKKLTDRPIPIVVFEGTLQQAHLESSYRNSKDNLNMGKDDKMNRAWRLVAMDDDLSKTDINRATGVATSSVGRMRNALVKLKEEREVTPEYYTEDFTEWTWEEARKGVEASRVIDEDWEGVLALEWAKRMSRTFGDKLVKQPEVFWKALEIHSEKLVNDLEDYLRTGWVEDPNPDF
ncbi:MAG: hypothetical protein EPN31_08915 [Castellaniella sp.]|uniref:ParB N-terminal domain-containing protein n=1 Tax=Castellaniella sp. TaxID=1955812 RepID=UPI0012286227|nr:ParB N-terminal domain-containing protein [Castellaniella sp.]TAN28266.1 MAG: hypothetical protein EPN31_08915 [Castellaniella sp.]